MSIIYTLEEELKLIKTLEKMSKGHAFNNYIKKITFPFFKNLYPDSKINFDFPLTILVGTNGTGKSSILRALQGAPKGKSIGNYWFSTSMDPIKETGESGKRNSFFYEYISGNEIKEVIKQRILRANDPDYWETSRPVLSYGMKPLPDGKRNPAVEKDVIYLDFRSELSAFDKYFHLGEVDVEKSLKEKKQYIRAQSKKLKTAITKNKIYSIRTKKQNESAINLTSEELEYISFILGREYTSGKLIKHKFFKDWGTSVVLDKKSFSYTEAMAGSGEIAIVKIVHELLSAPNESLILLDEPEVSVHPGAQLKLKFILLSLIKQKKHQVIISTHSTSFLESLPKNAIKKLEIEPISEKVMLKDECLMHEAFFTLGQKFFNTNYTIQTEDALATEIINRVMKEVDSNLASQWNICFNPGGAETIKSKFIPIYSQLADRKIFVILDGDKRPSEVPPQLTELPTNQLTCDNLETMINKLTGCKIEFNVDGNRENGGRMDQKLELQKKYLEFYSSNVFFLPLNTPEELIWNSDLIYSMLNNKPSILTELANALTFKEKIYIASKEIFGNDHSVPSLENLLITHWVSNESSEKNQIKDFLSTIIEQTNMKSYAMN